MQQEVSLFEVLESISYAMINAEPALTDLDSALGDGDCGHGMKQGFTAVLESIKGFNSASTAELLKKTAMALISAIGGTSGAIYGTAFMKMAASVNKATSRDQHTIINDALVAALEGAKMRGEDTRVGDKTLIDAFEPAVLAFKKIIEEGHSLAEAAAAATIAAQKGSDSTIGLIAKKGRASYLGERSIGHRDAGSYGVVVICKAIEGVLKKYIN